uniref:Uncharacterized protein n=1 Tax=Stomoxys calcitrans TaxID=35570 RepID=A0A1I8Q898_STOCA
MDRFFLNSIAICMVLLCSGSSVNSDATAQQKQKDQHYTNVFTTRNMAEILQTDLGVLKRRCQEQLKIVTALQPREGSDESDNGICERVTGLFDSINHKHKTFKDLIIEKLDDMQNDQSSFSQEILSLRSCSTAGSTAPADANMPKSLNGINDKIEKLQKLLTTLTSQRKLVANQNEEQLNLLQEISSKLVQHEGKFEIFEKQIPNLAKALNESKTLPKNNARLRMDLILGMTQKRGQ